jgi:hypothetical protein
VGEGEHAAIACDVIAPEVITASGVVTLDCPTKSDAKLHWAAKSAGDEYRFIGMSTFFGVTDAGGSAVSVDRDRYHPTIPGTRAPCSVVWIKVIG